MILAVMFWLAITFSLMRVLTWVAKRHPKARNASAFAAELLVAVAVAEALAAAGVVASGNVAWPRFLMNAIFVAMVAGVVHYLASNTATSPHALYPPFALASLLVLVLGSRIRFGHWVALGTLAVGCSVGWFKYREVQSGRKASVSDEVLQA